MADMLDVEVIADPAAAVSALDPIRSRLLAELTEPASAATLAARVGITRQKVNYHLRALRRAPARRRRGRAPMGRADRAPAGRDRGVLRRVARRAGTRRRRPRRASDRLSASYLIALAARAVREVGELWRAARDEEQATGDAVDRHRDPIPLAGGPRRVHPRPVRRGHDAGGALPRRIRPRRPRAPPGARRTADADKMPEERTRNAVKRKTIPAAAGSRWSSSCRARPNRCGTRSRPGPA